MGLEGFPKAGGTIKTVGDDIGDQCMAHLSIHGSASRCSTHSLNKEEKRFNNSKEGDDVDQWMVVAFDAHLHLNYHIDSLSWIRRGLFKPRPNCKLLLFRHV